MGTGEDVSIRELAETDRRGRRATRGETVWDTSKPDGTPRKLLDVSPAACALGWEPKVPMWEGVAETYEWFTSRPQGVCAWHAVRFVHVRASRRAT